MPHTHITDITDIDVMVIVERSDSSILLVGESVLRLPGGHLGPGESVLEAGARALHAGAGVSAEPAALRPVHVMQHRDEAGRVRVGWFLAAARWAGRASRTPAPAGGAPGRRADGAWYRPDRLPGHTAGYDALGIAHYLKGEPFSVHGW